MRKLLAAPLILLMAACAVDAPVQDRAAEVDARIEAITSALLPTVTIEGEPTKTPPLAERMEHYRVPAISVAVLIDGDIEWARGFGMANVETKRPATAETLFQAASISKPVAAAAVMKLVQQGRLSLDTDVNEQLTSWKLAQHRWDSTQPVTLRRLLSHTAGTTVHGFPGYADGTAVPTTVGVLNGEGNTAPIQVNIEPGSRWRYSGGGYTIAQQLLVDALQQPFPKLMDEIVLEPLGLTDSTYQQPLPEAWRKRAACGYRSDGTVVPGCFHTYPEMAAAGLWTTPSDLLRFALAIQKSHAGQPDTFFTPAIAREMLTPVLNNHAIGPAIMDDGTRFGHGGSNEGFRCQLTAAIDGSWGIAIMTNSDSGSRLARELLLTIAQSYGWEGFAPDSWRAIQLDSDTLQQLAGEYEIPGVATLKLEVREEKLWMVAPGQPESELLAQGDNRFIVREMSRPLTFLWENGTVTGFESGNLKARRR